VSRELARAGVLSEVDRGVLTAYVTAWSFMQEAAAKIKKDGGVVMVGRDKLPVKHPGWQIYREANRTMLAAAQQLYLTPVTRLRIPVAPGSAAIGDDDNDDAFD
jgi:P27 family predicted phage terminase small subunit